MMATCKGCIHFNDCLNEQSQTRYYGLNIACNDVEDRCKYFKDKYRFIELPCKVGDTVYTNIAMQGWYLRNKDKPYSAKVVFIGINDSKEMGYGFINVLYNGRNGCVYQFNFSDIGKTVFLTREEAEKALEEMRK